ncbi:MAG: helix-turn-helix domain-containing protein [Cyclobacteriaceae bacterium]|nr:helix-turn-helix domain-containing protein [Cyclobacteriaceae bacterium]
MEERIRLLMEEEKLTASKFADAIGVQRSSISHILSGRNKPSLELINKILDQYSDVNTDWLLLGKGPMKQTKESVAGKTAPHYSFQGNPTGRSPVKIVILYDDQSFEEFYPQK